MPITLPKELSLQIWMLCYWNVKIREPDKHCETQLKNECMAKIVNLPQICYWWNLKKRHIKITRHKHKITGKKVNILQVLPSVVAKLVMLKNVGVADSRCVIWKGKLSYLLHHYFFLVINVLQKPVFIKLEYTNQINNNWVWHMPKGHIPNGVPETEVSWEEIMVEGRVWLRG